MQSWGNARDYCAQYGMTLAIPQSTDEIDAIVLISQSIAGSIWIGITDKTTEGEWLTSDGHTVTLLDWNSGEPNNWGGNEDCGELITHGSSRGKINDVNCEASLGFVCETSTKITTTGTTTTIPITTTTTTVTAEENNIYIWHGEETVASWSLVGDYRTFHGPLNAVFDGLYGDENMYHSEKCDGSDYGGIIISFNDQIIYHDIVIHTRSSCCQDRYNNICLYADGNNVGCTPDNLDNPGNTLNLKEYTTIETVAKEFRLNWENDECAQIEELFFHYGT